MWGGQFKRSCGRIQEFAAGASAESGFVLHRLNKRISFIGHPSMHAPSLARVFDG